MIPYEAIVTERRIIANGVVELALARPDGSKSPYWAPGAHADLRLRDGLVRQYSLVGNPFDRSTLRVSVLNEPDGRGGSKFIHDEVRPGMRLVVEDVRNNFRLADAEHYIFIAGGIGITPLASMVQELRSRNADWQLIYLGQRGDTMAYLESLRALGDRVTTWVSSTDGRFDLERLLREPRSETLVYCCGPERLLDSVEDACADWPIGALHLERFAPRDLDEEDGALDTFDVELRRTGMTLRVDADTSIIDACDRVGVMVPTSCGEGTCGSCETVVLEGTPAHRDSVLNAEDRRSGQYIMPCVSRSLSPTLVLDL